MGMKAARIAAGAMPCPFRPADSGAPQPVKPAGRQVEQMPVAVPIREEPAIFGIVIHETRMEFRPDLRGPRADGGADDGANAGPGRAQFLHRPDGGLQHPAKGPAPSRMGGADHAGLRVGEQNRLAIGGQNRQRQFRRRGTQRIGHGGLRRPRPAGRSPRG